MTYLQMIHARTSSNLLHLVTQQREAERGGHNFPGRLQTFCFFSHFSCVLWLFATFSRRSFKNKCFKLGSLSMPSLQYHKVKQHFWCLLRLKHHIRKCQNDGTLHVFLASCSLCPPLTPSPTLCSVSMCRSRLANLCAHAAGGRGARLHWGQPK